LRPINGEAFFKSDIVTLVIAKLKKMEVSFWESKPDPDRALDNPQLGKSNIFSDWAERYPLIFFTILLMLMQSCVFHKDLLVIQDNLEDEILYDTTLEFHDLGIFSPYVIRPHDQLLIRVNAFTGSTEEFISREMSTQNRVSRQDYEPPSIYFNSYSVTDSGYISLPLLDKVKVTGMTNSDLKEFLDEAYKPYLKLVSTTVKLANSRVTIIGEVEDPGVHYLYQEQNTLMDVIGLAGDFTDFANRKKVKVVRQTEFGAKSVVLDLSRPEFFESEFFYAQPHDVVYIEPVKSKSFDVSARSVGLILSGISLATLIVNVFVRRN
jgi:polysaccharide export outer membrane protein